MSDAITVQEVNESVVITTGLLAGVRVRKNSGGTTSAFRERLNFIEGAGITLTITDDAANGEVDVQIDAPTGGAPIGAQYVVVATDATLTAERRLLAGAGLTLVDGGAGGDVTLAVGAGTGILANADDVAINQAFSPTWTGTHTHDGVLLVPRAAAPAQTAEGSVVWDSDDDKLTVGTGAARKVLVDQDRQVTAGAGLTGGGDLSADRTLTVGAGTLIVVGADDVGLAAGAAADQVIVTGATPFTPAYKALSALAGAGLGTSGAAGSQVLDVATGPGLAVVSDAVEWSGVTVRKNTGADVGTRRRLNLIEGANVTLTVADDAAGGEVDVTFAAASFAPTAAQYVVLALDGTLSAERRLVAGAGLTLVDAGANADATLAVGAGTGITVNADDVQINLAFSPTWTGTHTHDGALVVPRAVTPAQTAEGSVVWDSDNDALTIGTGAGRKTLVDHDRTISTTGGLTGGGTLAADRTFSWSGVTVRKNTGVDIGTRRRINLIEGANVTLTVADDAAADEVDVTIASSAGGGGGAPTDAQYLVLATHTSLSAERRLVPGGGLTGTDGGADGDYTLAVGAGTGITVNADDVQVNQAFTPTWTGLHIFNPGTTPTEAVSVRIAQPVAAGTRDSHHALFRGTSFDASGHDVDWRVFVDVTANAGASSFLLQSRIDAAAFADRFKIGDDGLVTVNGRITGLVAPAGTSDAVHAGRSISTGTGLSGGGNLTADRTLSWLGLTVRKNTGVDIGTRRRLNLIEGSNVTLTVADDAAADEVDVTVAASFSGAPIGAQYLVLALDGTLTGERRLLAGAGLTLTDAGANADATLAVGAGTGITVNADDVAINQAFSPTWTGTHTHDGALVVPRSTTPAQIAEGSLVWDSDDDKLTIGTGAARKVLVNEDRSISTGTGLAGGGDLSANRTLTWNGVTVRKNTGVDVGTRRRLNLIEGTNITLSVVDDAAGDEVDVTITASGAGGGAPTDAQYVVLALHGSLTAERRLLAGNGLTITDGGADADVTLQVVAASGSNLVANADDLDWTGVTVRKDSGANVGTRPRLNFIQGANVTLTIADDGVDDEVDITIAAAGGAGGMAWSEVTGTTQAASVNSGYVTNNAGLVTVTLPAAFALGDIVRVVGKGAGKWKVQASAGDVIHYGDQDSSAGGAVEATHRYDSAEFVCITANGDWSVGQSHGNLAVT